MQETWQAIDSAPDVVIILMLFAAGMAILVFGPAFFFAGLARGDDQRRRLTNLNLRLVDDNARLLFDNWRLEGELNRSVSQAVGDVHERMAGRN